MTDVDYSAASQLSPSSTIIFIVAVSLLLLGAFVNAMWRALRHRGRARDAAASVSNAEPRLAPGQTRRLVLRGTVHTDDPERPAIVVTVRERGEEVLQRGSWSHTWTEFDRHVQVEPFDLTLASGTRVRVEPDPDVFLVDKLEISERGNPRTRSARLEHGEIAYVDGVLTAGWRPHATAAEAAGDGAALYRGAPPTGLLMTNGIERMLISTEPLALRHERRFRVHRTMAAALGVGLLLLNTVLFGSTHMVNLLGDVVETRVIAKRTWVTTNKGTSTVHYGVRASYVDPTTGRDVEVADEVGYATYSAAQNGKAPPFRVVLRWPTFASVGTGATVGVVHLTLVALLVPLLLGAYVMRVRSAREWFDRDILVERGSGRLQL